MKAARIHQFGPPSVMVIDELPRPTPGHGEVLVRVAAAGVGPWDALIREHKSVVQTPLPLMLGSDLSSVIEEVGPGVSAFQAGDEIYGVTNPNFCGAYTEYAIASAAMVARKPQGLSHVEAASVPVVAVTAWQMLFDYAQANPGQTILIHGAAGNVGAYAVQLAPEAVKASTLAGEPITARLMRAPGNSAPIGGLKVVTASGWFAARPSGTEQIYKIYAESFRDETHLDAIVAEAQHIVDNALQSSGPGRR